MPRSSEAAWSGSARSTTASRSTGTARSVTSFSRPGPAALNVPEELAGDARTVHAYEPHEYADDVAVVGAGMAAATEWRNALAAGARVTSVRRREPLRRPLSVPRPLLTRRGLGAFHATAPIERAATLETLLAPSYPPGREWDEPLEQAGERFRVEAEVNGAAQIICATGFRRGFGAQPLLAQLVAEHGLETRGELDRARARLHRAGPHERRAHARPRRGRRPVGLPRRRHAGGREVRGARLPPSGAAMSYTLRGRIDSRLLAAIAPLVVACLLALTLHRWWPVEIGAVMVGVGVALDVALYHRVFAYQPGWVALPLGVLELALVVSLARFVGIVAPLGAGSCVLRRRVAARPGVRARRLPVAAALVCGGRRRARTPRDRRGRIRRRDPAGRERRRVRDPAADRDAARGGRARGRS